MRRRETGAAVVEMAISLLLLIWLVLGIVDVGRAIFTDIGLKEAAQAAAHHMAFTETATAGSAAQVGVDSTTNPQADPARFTIACDPVTRGGELYGTITVAVEHDLELITPLVGSALGGILTLQETAEAERYFACP